MAAATAAGRLAGWLDDEKQAEEEEEEERRNCTKLMTRLRSRTTLFIGRDSAPVNSTRLDSTRRELERERKIVPRLSTQLAIDSNAAAGLLAGGGDKV